MKINRKTLKELVKECLIELLAEGLSTDCGARGLSEEIDRSTPSSGVRGQQIRRSQDKRPKFDPSLDRPILEAARAAAGADNVMAGILADTAKTTFTRIGHTLQTSEGAASGVMDALGGGMPTHGLDAVSQTVADHEPAEMFGDDAVGNWAALAFANSKGPLKGS